MRFLPLALFVVSTATCCMAVDLDRLVNLSEEAGAAFTPEAYGILQNSSLWGAKRANRSSDVVIMNASTVPFLLNATTCTQGKLSEGLLPAKKLRAKSSIVYGIDSTSFLSGVQCTIKYASAIKESTWFSMVVDVPFFDDNDADGLTSSDLQIVPSYTTGNNNEVVFIIADAFIESSLRSAPAGGLPPKKRKGNRRKFVRTRKSGSRSHQL